MNETLKRFVDSVDSVKEPLLNRKSVGIKPEANRLKAQWSRFWNCQLNSFEFVWIQLEVSGGDSNNILTVSKS